MIESGMTSFEIYLIALGVLGLAFLLVAGVFFLSLYVNRKFIERAKWKELINQILLETVQNGVLEKDERILVLLKNRRFRNMFVDGLMNSVRRFKGEVAQNILQLYRIYELEYFSLRKLNSFKSYRVARGINELRAMQVETAIPKIQKLLRNSSTEIFEEAQYALVDLKGFNGLDFPEDLVHTVSRWQQMKLLSAIHFLPTDASETILKWLRHKNPSVVVFALKLVHKFQLFHFLESVLHLLNHPEISVRKKAVRILDTIDDGEVSEKLRANFGDQPTEIQLEILRMLHILKDKNLRDFLLNLLKYEAPISVKIHAAEILFSWGFEQDLIEISQPELIHIINHALRRIH